MLKTEFEFSLPLGFIDAEGELHRDGLMRLATAADEILPLRDPRVRSNEAYLTIIVLSRVITRLGSLERVTPGVIERLFAADLAYLQDVYNRINRPPHFGAGAAIDADGDRHPLDEDHAAAWENGTARSASSAAGCTVCCARMPRLTTAAVRPGQRSPSCCATPTSRPCCAVSASRSRRTSRR